MTPNIYGSLVTVFGYQVDKLFEMAYHRLSTIASGTSLFIFITMVFCPIWASSGLHDLIVRNLEKIADSLDGVHEQRSLIEHSIYN